MKITVIENDIEFSRLKALLSNGSALAVPILADASRHPCANRLSLLGIAPLSAGELFILPVAHYDSSYRAPIADLSFERLVVPDRKLWEHVRAPSAAWTLDLGASHYVAGTSGAELVTPAPASALRRTKQPWTNAIAPLGPWADAISAFVRQCAAQGIADTAGFWWLNSIAMPELRKVEAAGLHVRQDLWDQHFGKPHLLHDSLVYSTYNLFTAAGRPSCRHGGVNFGAIPKGEKRSAFTSRHENGAMVLIDYESFHIRLIAEMIGATLPSTDIHDHFGRLYYGGVSRDGAKATTFAHLYGDTDTDIPFFVKVREYREALWEQALADGHVVAPTGLHFDPHQIGSASKLFNYMIQNKETRHNLDRLADLHALDASSQIVLYNYDSFLIDYDESDGRGYIDALIERLEEDGKFPVCAYKGDSYGNLETIYRGT